MFKNIIITGASSGLGRALARGYAAPGSILGLLGRDTARLNETARICRDLGAIVHTSAIDVRESFGLMDWIRDFDEKYPVDLIIANAGITYSAKKDKPIEPRTAIRDVMDTNFTAVIDTVNPLLERMRLRREGSAVIISSLSAYRGIPLFPAYSASKAAIKTYYDAIRGGMAEDGVFITVACPGFIQTPMTEKLRTDKLKQLQVDHAASLIIKGVSKRRGLVTFPLLPRLGLWLAGFLPVRLTDRIINRIFFP